MLLEIRGTDSPLVQTRTSVAAHLVVESNPSIGSVRDFEGAENVLPGFIKDSCLDNIQNPLCSLFTKMDIIVILEVVVFRSR